MHLLPHTKPEFRKWKVCFTRTSFSLLTICFKPPEPFFEPQRKVPPPDHLIVTASFGRIVPSTVLNLFPQNQRLNIHPSLLPAYRGAAPLQHTIANGEKETGVCIIDMLKFSEGIDSGPIWASTRMVGVHSVRYVLTFVSRCCQMLPSLLYEKQWLWKEEVYLCQSCGT